MIYRESRLTVMEAQKCTFMKSQSRNEIPTRNTDTKYRHEILKMAAHNWSRGVVTKLYPV